jgi:polar amino acid transport system substrate-binding protein
MDSIQRLGYTDIVALEPPLSESNFYHYLNSKHSEILLPRITAVLQEMSDSGRIDEIREQITAEILGS